MDCRCPGVYDGCVETLCILILEELPQLIQYVYSLQVGLINVFVFLTLFSPHEGLDSVRMRPGSNK